MLCFASFMVRIVNNNSDDEVNEKIMYELIRSVVRKNLE